MSGRIWLGVFASLCLCCSGCGGGNESPPAQSDSGGEQSAAAQTDAGSGPAGSASDDAGESPEAAFAALKQAAEQEDWDAAARLLTDDSQTAIAGMLVFVGGLVAAFDAEEGKGLEELMEKHGLSEDVDPEPPPGTDLSDPLAMVKALASVVEDKPAFIGEVMDWMVENADSTEDPDFAAAKLTDLVIDGDTASATVTGVDVGDTIEFRRVDGKWLVHLPEEHFEMAGTAGGAMDFGPSQEFDEFDFGFDESDPLPPVDAVTRDEFDNAWKTSLDVQDAPAIDEIRKLAAECELEIADVPELAEKLSQPVTLTLSDVSRLEAIEQICAQVGVYPKYRLHQMTFRDGPRAAPAVAAGPFLLLVKSVEQNAPYPTGRVELQILAANLPVAAIARLKELSVSDEEEGLDSFTVRIAELVGTGDQTELRDGYFGGMMMETVASPSLILLNQTLRLKNLVKSVTHVDRLAGELSFDLPTSIETFRFERLDPDTTVESGGVTMTLKDAGSNVEVEYKGADGDRIVLVVLDADGEQLPSNGSGSFGFGDEGSVSQFVEGEPASVEARLMTETERITLPFEITKIPLPQADQMPESIEPLSFEGDVPITIEFVRVQGEGNERRVVYKMTNNTNKGLESLHLQQEYLDAGGEVLDDFPHSQSGYGEMVAAGASEEIEVSAFFMPEETKTVRAAVETARFVDASLWELEQ